MSEYILTSNNLCKYYGNMHAVDGISMHIKKGAIYGLIGRNGAGKTTFMKVVCGLSKQTKGDITLFGETGAGLGKVRSKIANLIEAPGIFHNMSAFDNMKFKCYAFNCYDKNYIMELLTLVGLQDTGKKKAGKFSLGMRQRLGIALALVGNPEFLVLDEPINGLDPQGIAEMRDIIQKLNTERGITILISSHILGELSRVATDYGIVEKGRLIREMTALELEEAQSDYLEIKVNDTETATEVLKGMNILQYEVVNPTTIKVKEKVSNSAEVNKKLIMTGLDVAEISYKGGDLEDFYLELTGGEGNA